MSIFLPMIKLQHVNKYFNGHKAAVTDVSFAVQAGETLVLLGTSGSGKTTTLRMINRLIAPSSGTIYVNDRPVNGQPVETLRRGIGYVLQDNGLFPHYTVAENIAVVPRLLRWDKKRIEERTLALMEKLHLPASEYLHTYPQQLSGGQQQRVGLARALAADPPVLLMDEPFGALDPVTRANVRKEFLSLDELHSKTIILVTHDVQEAFELGNRICLMDKGAIQQLGTPAELLFTPANDFVRSFFEEHRLLLELKALTLEDIRPFLTDGSTGTQSQIAGAEEQLQQPAAPGEEQLQQAAGSPGTQRQVAGAEKQLQRQTAGSTGPLSPQSTCWEALERTMATDAPLNVMFPGKAIGINSHSLMTALAQYKQTVATHGRTTKLS